MAGNGFERYFVSSDCRSDTFSKSLLILRTQIDNRGAILAANDSDIMATNRDNYSYMCVRDASFCVSVLAKAGFEEPCRRFLISVSRLLRQKDTFFINIIPMDRLVLHGIQNCRWRKRLPIQEDESALVLVALDHYLTHFHSLELIQRFFSYSYSSARKLASKLYESRFFFATSFVRFVGTKLGNIQLPPPRVCMLVFFLLLVFQKQRGTKKALLPFVRRQNNCKNPSQRISFLLNTIVFAEYSDSEWSNHA